MVEEHDVGIDQDFFAERAMPPLGGSVIFHRARRSQTHRSMQP
jgi:hypothetical protein